MDPLSISVVILISAGIVAFGVYGVRLQLKQSREAKEWFANLQATKTLKSEGFQEVSDNVISGKYLGHSVGCYYVEYKGKINFSTYLEYDEQWKDKKAYNEFHKKYKTEAVSADGNKSICQLLKDNPDLKKINRSFDRLIEIAKVEGLVKKWKNVTQHQL